MCENSKPLITHREAKSFTFHKLRTIHFHNHPRLLYWSDPCSPILFVYRMSLFHVMILFLARPSIGHHLFILYISFQKWLPSTSSTARFLEYDLPTAVWAPLFTSLDRTISTSLSFLAVAVSTYHTHHVCIRAIDGSYHFRTQTPRLRSLGSNATYTCLVNPQP